MASNKDKALALFLEHKGNITNRKIAELLGEKEKTISAWKSRGKWNVVLQENNCSTTDKKCSTTKKRGAPKGNRNAAGHGAPPGNKNAVGNSGGAPKGNSNAVIHGLHAKYLPSETLEIADSLVDVSPIDILWGNICIKYASILRAQQIMYVTDKDEMIKELKRSYEKKTEKSTAKTQTDSNECEYEYEFQFSWDRHATFLKAQSLAMSTLSNMIKQYESLCKSDLATEEQRARIDKLKAEVDKLKAGGDGVGSEEAVQFVDDIGSDDDADG